MPQLGIYRSKNNTVYEIGTVSQRIFIKTYFENNSKIKRIIAIIIAT